VQAALLAQAGATVDPRAIHGPLGFEEVLGAGWPPEGIGVAGRADAALAVERNWIKLYPSCLGTHSPIEAAAYARDRGYRPEDGQLTVVVHPVARQAAHLDRVSDGLSAKFSIPYCVAHTLIHGPPRVRDFAAIDAGSRDRSRFVAVAVDESLPEFGAVLTDAGRELARVPCPRGTPARPVTAAELAGKISDLAGDRLDGVLDDLDAPAAAALNAAGLRGTKSTFT
jgi:2-methylcitrate dehydratase PrpD